MLSILLVAVTAELLQAYPVDTNLEASVVSDVEIPEVENGETEIDNVDEVKKTDTTILGESSVTSENVEETQTESKRSIVETEATVEIINDDEKKVDISNKEEDITKTSQESSEMGAQPDDTVDEDILVKRNTDLEEVIESEDSNVSTEKGTISHDGSASEIVAEEELNEGEESSEHIEEATSKRDTQSVELENVEDKKATEEEMVVTEDVLRDEVITDDVQNSDMETAEDNQERVSKRSAPIDEASEDEKKSLTEEVEENSADNIDDETTSEEKSTESQQAEPVDEEVSKRSAISEDSQIDDNAQDPEEGSTVVENPVIPTGSDGIDADDQITSSPDISVDTIDSNSNVEVKSIEKREDESSSTSEPIVINESEPIPVVSGVDEIAVEDLSLIPMQIKYKSQTDEEPLSKRAAHDEESDDSSVNEKSDEKDENDKLIEDISNTEEKEETNLPTNLEETEEVNADSSAADTSTIKEKRWAQTIEKDDTSDVHIDPLAFFGKQTVEEAEESQSSH